MDWTVTELENGRRRYGAKAESGHSARVYEWQDGSVSWHIFDPDGERELKRELAEDVEQAKREAEQAIGRLVRSVT